MTGYTTTIEEDESGNFEITNKIPRDYLFPSTGGSGTISYYVIGLFILLATIFMSIRVRKNKVKL
ncbi:LPXTG cell wall anchor domain-containing protein [Streptococcus gallolyticus]|uniref:LPXTG cell wall anchor domain-containing protein n=1 Tax=Streptococcus gallolyticus TaxID=315405 RepID=UPI003D6DC9CF